jgi:hypothetical protein
MGQHDNCVNGHFKLKLELKKAICQQDLVLCNTGEVEVLHFKYRIK